MSRRTRPVALLLIVALLLAAFSAVHAQEGELEKTALNIGLTVPTLAYLPLYAAVDQGLFEERGLDVTLVTFRGGSENLRAVVAGEIDISSGSISELINGLAAEQPLQMIWALNNAQIYELWASPDVASWDNAAGKSFAISSIGALSHYVTDYMVRAAGLTPEDVNLVAAGGPAERWAALQAGQVDVAILSQPTSLIAEREGFVRLASMADYVDNWQNQIFYTTEEFIASNPNTIRAFLDAVIQGAQLVDENPDMAVELIVEYIGYSEEDATGGYPYYQNTWPYNGEPAVDGIQLLTDLQLASGDIAQAFTLDELVDWTFILERGGEIPSAEATAEATEAAS